MPQSKLPVFAIFWIATRGVIANLGKVALLCWPGWLIVLAVLIVAAETRDLKMEPPLRGLLIAAFGLSIFGAFVQAFHAWLHRSLTPDATSTTDHKRLTVRFLLHFVVLVIVITAPLALAIFAIPEDQAQSDVASSANAAFRFMGVLVFALLPAIYFACRLVLVLPAKSLRLHFGWTDAWQLSAGNGLRMLAIFLLISYVGLLSFSAATTVIGFLANFLPLPDRYATGFAAVLVGLLSVQLIGMVHMSALAHIYRHLALSPDERARYPA